MDPCAKQYVKEFLEESFVRLIKNTLWQVALSKNNTLIGS